MAGLKLNSELRAQAETIIRFDETGGLSHVYTACKRVADKLIKAGLTPVRTSRFKGYVDGWWFECDSRGVAVKPFERLVRLGVDRREKEPQEESTEGSAVPGAPPSSTSPRNPVASPAGLRGNPGQLPLSPCRWAKDDV